MDEHHLFSAKHHRLLNKCKYVRRKINEGTLEDWKREMLEEIAEMRDLTIHTGGEKIERRGCHPSSQLRIDFLVF